MTGSQTRQNNSRLSIEVVLFTLVFNIPLLFAVIIIVVICYYYYCCCSDGVFVVVDIWCCCCCCFSSRLLRTRAHFSQQCTAARRCARSINRKNQKEIDRFRCTDISICLSFACWACWFASGFAFRIGGAQLTFSCCWLFGLCFLSTHFKTRIRPFSLSSLRYFIMGML